LLNADFLSTQNIISVISKAIDFFVVLIIGISALQSIIPAITSIFKIPGKEKSNIAIKSFIKTLLLSLELESANAILKMGLFVSSTNDTDYIISSTTNNFIFFVAVLSIRIAINQTLRRFSIDKYIK
jgi:hypothetical protein